MKKILKFKINKMLKLKLILEINNMKIRMANQVLKHLY